MQQQLLHLPCPFAFSGLALFHLVILSARHPDGIGRITHSSMATRG